MKMIKVFVALLAATILSTANAEDYVGGKDYRVLEQPLKTSKRAIEVAEFFWYGCGHCYNFEPYMHKFETSAADDVKIVRSPAMWNGVMREHAKLYFALAQMKATFEQQQKVFVAISVERRRLADVDSMAELVAELGLDAERFRALFASFPVDSQVRMADVRQRKAGVTGTPQVMVAGKYVVGSTRENPISLSEIIEITEYLVEKERKERAK